MAKHRGVANRRALWQIRLEWKHRLWAAERDLRSDWKEFWLDVAEWRAERRGNK